MVLLELPESSNDLEWRAPYFAESKPKRNQLNFLSDFININKQLKPKPY